MGDFPDPAQARRHGDHTHCDAEIRRLDQLMALHWKTHDDLHAQSVVDLQHRFDAVNELRGQLSDVINTMAPKSDMKIMMDLHYKLESEMLRRFEAMTTYVQAEAGPGKDLKTSQMAIVAAVVLAISIMGAIMVVINFAIDHLGGLT